MTQMSVAAALAELKLLDARTQRGINDARLVAIRVGDDNRISGVPLSDFNRNAEASLQSFNALTERRMLIKSLIVESNARTMVTIGEKTMTVAAAIETRKHSIGYKRAMLKSMENQWTTAVSAMEKSNAKLRAELTAQFGKQAELPAIATAIQAQYDAASYNLVNPVQLERKIEALKAEIEAFDAGFDLAINASNYANMIDV